MPSADCHVGDEAGSTLACFPGLGIDAGEDPLWERDVHPFNGVIQQGGVDIDEGHDPPGICLLYTSRCV